jgi:hypothetical protein
MLLHDCGFPRYRFCAVRLVTNTSVLAASATLRRTGYPVAHGFTAFADPTSENPGSQNNRNNEHNIATISTILPLYNTMNNENKQ